MRDKTKRLSALFTLGDAKLDTDPIRAPPAGAGTSPSPTPVQYLSPLLPSSGSRALPASPVRGRSASPFRSASPAAGAGSDKRRSWRSRSRAASTDEADPPPYWLALSGKKFSYDPAPLAAFQRIPELWDEQGDTLVFLAPQDADRPPSFKIHSSTYASSFPLISQAHGPAPKPLRRQSSLETSTSSLSLEVPPLPSSTPPVPDLSDGPPQVGDVVPPPEPTFSIYLPVAPAPGGYVRSSAEELEALLAIRNLFAFLLRRPLVASPERPTNLHIFKSVAQLLRVHQFTNQDGSGFGEVPSTSFAHYLEDLRLADVRNSPYKIVEGIVIGEHMRSLELYNEAFVHGVGKFDSIKELPSGMFHLVSGITRNRMERAHMDLYQRLKNVRSRLTDFEFPSLFSGIANSTSLEEAKSVHFKRWKGAFQGLRKHILTFYKDQFGAWPPKASSKKNEFEEGGLNRIVLQLLYRDLSDLYDLMVDRSVLTSRSVDVPHQDDQGDVPDPEEPTPRALRRVMSEYDRSSPPVQPPIPFDTPLLPTLSSQDRVILTAKTSKLSADEISRALDASYNADAQKPTLFLAGFKAYERKAASGKSLEELCDQRNGHWILLYAALQSLPLLVVDAPGVKWNRGVEYFLCEPPLGGAPWASSDHSRRKSWYGVAGGTGGVVSLPSDVVDHGIEGVYRRSHCWEAAARWTAHEEAHIEPTDPNNPPSAAELRAALGSLSPPPPVFSNGAGSGPPTPTSPVVGSATRSPRNPHRNTAVFLGLEALPLPNDVAPEMLDLPRGATPDAGNRNRVSVHDPSKSFDDIVGGAQVQVSQGKR
ncbi:MAG: hypothetical protein M1832_005017 [Thelocarpon impressellum]|nr:MAG: hypothetical protein M1832_005017 [Thelocarpon impressellum]